MSEADPALIAAYDQAKANGADLLAGLRKAIKENTNGDSPVEAAVAISMTLEMLPEITLRTLLQAALIELDERDANPTD